MRDDYGMADQTELTTGVRMLPITGLVPMIPVVDVERSVKFYRLLGFSVGNRVPRDGCMNWTWLYAPGAPNWRHGPNLMLSRSERVIDASVPGVLFYLYASDLISLRQQMVTAGLSPGPIEYPDYLPNGEFAVQDPDGYRLMLAQSSADTP